MSRIGYKYKSSLFVALLLLTVAAFRPVAAEATSSGDLFAGLPVLVQLALLVLLICLSGVFCGLTLGIMGLDTNSLEIIADAGREPDRSFAKVLLPIRKMGHQSLATLILGNMLGNVLISQLVQDVTPAGEQAVLVSFIVATLVILIFAEVLPMSVCRGPHALEIAAAGVPILRAFLVLLYPIAKPLGLLLDLITPHDAGQIYDRNELKKLMRIHCEAHSETSGMELTELKLLIGAMEFHEEVVGHVMTPLADVCMLSNTTPVSRELVERLWKEGKSRVPIYSDDDRRNITGLLFVKDLVSLLAFRSGHVSHDSADYGGLTVGQLSNSNSTHMVRVQYSTTLPNVLRMFKSGRAPHLLFVEEDPETAGVSFGNRFVGIVTLEDVIEKLIKSEIRDEYDDSATSEEVDIGAAAGGGEVSDGGPNGGAAATSEPDTASPVNHQPSSVVPVAQHGAQARPSQRKTLHLQKAPRRPPRINFNGFYPSVQPLNDDQKWVLADFLQRTVAAFCGWRIGYVKLLLDEVGDRVVRVDSDSIPVGLGKDGSLADFQGNRSTMLDVEGPMDSCTTTTASGPMKRGKVGHEALLRMARSDIVLYRYQVASTDFVLILHGGARVVVGEDLFSSESRTFSMFGEKALSLNDADRFIPDFSLFVSRTSRLLVINQCDYRRVEGYSRRAHLVHAASNRSFAAPLTGVANAAHLPHNRSFS